MERRNFLQTTGLLTALGILPGTILQANNQPEGDPLLPFLLPPAAPLSHNGNMDVRTLVRSGMTGGVYSCVECAVAPKVMGPPPHLHKALNELMFVLEGTASVLVGDEIVEVPAGGWHFRPCLIRHTFWNASDKPLRFVDMYFNQPFEEFLEKIFHEFTPENGYVQGSEKLRKVHDELNELYGLVYAPNAGEERQEIAKKYGLK